MNTLFYLTFAVLPFFAIQGQSLPVCESAPPSCLIEEDCQSPPESCNGPIFLENIRVDCPRIWRMDVRAAYFSPNSKALRKVYSDGWLDFQVEASRQIFEYMDLWLGVSWAGKQNGHIEPFRYGLDDHTKISLVPISLGLKFIYPLFGCVEGYLGAGVCYSFLEIRNRFVHESSSCDGSSNYYKGYYGYSSCGPLKRNICKSGVGGLFKTGFRYTMSKSTFLDVFADYYLQRFKFPKNSYYGTNKEFFHGNLDCGGWKFGAGLGVYF